MQTFNNQVLTCNAIPWKDFLHAPMYSLTQTLHITGVLAETDIPGAKSNVVYSYADIPSASVHISMKLEESP